MNGLSVSDKVSVCKKDVCVHVYGELARVLAMVLIVAAVAYGARHLAKALK